MRTFDERISGAIVQTLQIIPLEPCGVGYWIISSVQVPLAVVFTAWMVLRKESIQDQTLIPQVHKQHSFKDSFLLLVTSFNLLAANFY